jgi:hypothetical protein
MGYAEKGDRMANSFTIQCQRQKWIKRLFFHLMDLIILNSFLLLTSCGARMTHRQFRTAFKHNFIEKARILCYPCQPMDRPMALEKQATRLAVNFSNHWPVWSCLFHIDNKKESTCEVQGLWCATLCWWAFWSLPHQTKGMLLYIKVLRILGHPLQRCVKRKYLFYMFPAGQSGVIPRRPAYGVPDQEQI